MSVYRGWETGELRDIIEKRGIKIYYRKMTSIQKSTGIFAR